MSGSTVASDNNQTLHATNLPPNQFGSSMDFESWFWDSTAAGSNRTNGIMVIVRHSQVVLGQAKAR